MGNYCRYYSLYQDRNMAKLKPQFDALQLNFIDVGRLQDIFRAVDADHSGNIELSELMNHLEVDNCDFRNRVFSIFDADNSGSVDFREFVLALWNYCTLTQASLEMFAFDLYDKDSTGELSPVEIDYMLRDLYGKHYEHNQHAMGILRELKKMAINHLFNIDKFHHFVHNHPALLFPAFKMQHHLRMRVLGVRFWDRAAKRRMRLTKNGRFVSMESLLKMNVSRNNLVKRTDGSRADIDVNQDQAVAMVLEGTGTHHYRSRHAQKSPENSQRTAQDDSLDGHDQHKQHHAHSKTPKAAMAENINNLLHEKLSDPADPIGKDILKIANAQTKILSPRADDFKHHHNHNNHQNHHAAAVKSPSADKRRQRDADNHNHKKPVHTGVRQTQVVKVHPSGADLESHLASKTKTDPNGRRYTYS